MTDTPQATRQFILDEGKKWAVRFVFGGVTIATVAILTPFGHKTAEIWSSPERLQSIDQKIDLLSEAIAAIRGEDRVTSQPDGMSYVKEPVFAGDPVKLVMFIGRTQSGAGCILREFIPQFTDDNGVTLSGEPRRPRVQLPAVVVRREIMVNQPEGLAVGRMGVHLQLEYKCGDETVFEPTKPVFYYVREKE